jgi:hypothetical protein
MTTIINAATSGGLIQTADTSGELQLQTASTAAVTITAAQLVGVGGTPAQKFNVIQGTKATTAAVTNIAGFNSTDASTFGLFVRQKLDATAANRYMGLTVFDNGVGSAPLVLQDLGSNVLIGTTTNNASGGVLQLAGGITFPATQVAASNVNTLDDYEEGTWTPDATGSASAGVTVYGTRTGSYTKIGNQVTATLYMNITSMTGTGSLLIGGLPFTNSSASYTTGSLMVNTTPFPAGTTSPVLYLAPSRIYFEVYCSGSNAGWSTLQTDSLCEFLGTVTYLV